MTFTIENKDLSIIKITIMQNLTLDEFKKILGVFNKVFQMKKSFSFYVHCNLSEVPIEIPQLSKCLISWMKDSHDDIVKYLVCSSIIFKSDLVVAAMNAVFKIKSPAKPNYITTDYKLGENFVIDSMKAFLKKI